LLESQTGRLQPRQFKQHKMRKEGIGYPSLCCFIGDVCVKERNRCMLPAGAKINLNSQNQQHMHEEYVIGSYKPGCIRNLSWVDYMIITELRQEYHREICQQIVRIQKEKKGSEYPNFADGSNVNSRQIAWEIVKQFNCPISYETISGLTSGQRFERITRNFLESAFRHIQHLRPGKWIYSSQTSISEFEQYEHLSYLDQVIKKDKKLEAALRGSYIIPDITVGRWLVEDSEINQHTQVIDASEKIAELTPLRQANRQKKSMILHASVSCKWTIRTEALNLIRNRKGPLPHVVAVTAEPTPHRLASLALGTGDLDCVYHFALYELIEGTKRLGLEDAHSEIEMMVDGKRLRDISDLPFDLAI
jgi:hypothetical protein